MWGKLLGTGSRHSWLAASAAALQLTEAGLTAAPPWTSEGAPHWVRCFTSILSNLNKLEAGIFTQSRTWELREAN